MKATQPHTVGPSRTRSQAVRDQGHPSERGGPRAFGSLSGAPRWEHDPPGVDARHTVGGRPNAGNSRSSNVVISATTPCSMRRTSNLNARNAVSPGRRR